MSHATHVGNKRKQTEDRKTFVIFNIVSNVSSPSKKTDQNEVNLIQNLLKCSIYLIAQVKNKSVKWSIKPCIVRRKQTSKALRQEIVDWIMKNSNVRQYPITRDTLFIADADTKVKHRVPKLVLECSMRQLHNDLIASPGDGGLLGTRHAKTNDVIICDTMFCSLAPPQLRPMTDLQYSSW